VVCEYPNVFSTDYSGLPPHREVEFGIECVPGNNPISKAPHRMASLEVEGAKGTAPGAFGQGFYSP
jgi:hypothetical protein